MHKHISSLQNPLIKHVMQLQEKSRERKKSGVFVLEGQQEIELALEGGYLLKTLFFCSEIISEAQLSKVQAKVTTALEAIEITKVVYEKIAYRKSTEGVIAIVQSKEQALSSLEFSNKNPLLLVAEAPEKPGNIGAILRTADAANVDAVLIANMKTDLYNPNVIRSSVGCLFTNTVATGTTSEIIAFLKAQKITIYCAALQASVAYHTCDFEKSTAIVMGTEATGLSTEWLENSDQNIIIPMLGKVDSMNVSVAAGILIFEAKRQRNFL
ncbi:TrmH family RNA methyltransferase [Cochleicola gelatinilyticus]|uniref:rRNA methyltransferase n=1 Tax=Cochleicola gelatinilyticus TaxID=1763537 RepID=A0A167HVF7_9FLAO|nr:RNA methyltransferase [Cochleicola gelatinilyticus]OAB79001.1 rRNA methyltransferase [Cochleicola gelatinilyticus]